MVDSFWEYVVSQTLRQNHSLAALHHLSSLLVSKIEVNRDLWVHGQDPLFTRHRTTIVHCCRKHKTTVASTSVNLYGWKDLRPIKPRKSIKILLVHFSFNRKHDCINEEKNPRNFESSVDRAKHKSLKRLLLHLPISYLTPREFLQESLKRQRGLSMFGKIVTQTY